MWNESRELLNLKKKSRDFKKSVQTLKLWRDVKDDILNLKIFTSFSVSV